MHIVEKISQHRRDFSAWIQCEFCEAEKVKMDRGYDDMNFHQNVIPNIECDSCGRKGSENPKGPRSSPDVPEGVVL